MSNQKNSDVKENNNVIRGPWSKSKRKVKVPDEEVLVLEENMEFAEDLNQKIVLQMIQMMGENGIAVADKAFIRDLGLIIELIKGSIYRNMGIPHPTHKFFETLVDFTIDDDKNVYSQINLDMFNKFVENFEKDNESPEIS